MKPKVDPPVCIALDVPTLDEATALVDQLGDRVKVFKVGFQLFTAAGPAAVAEVHRRGCEVFLDLKIADIPNTAAGAVRAAAEHRVAFLTIHGNGGRAMVRSAVEAARSDLPNLLVVTALTSLDEESLREIGVARSVSEQVDAMAELAEEEGAAGIVLAAGEVARIRAHHPDLFLLVPGIRPAGVAEGDQRRVGTPAEAVSDGADLIVLGRAVTQAPDPRRALEPVLAEIEQARPRRSEAETQNGVGMKA